MTATALIRLLREHAGKGDAVFVQSGLDDCWPVKILGIQDGIVYLGVDEARLDEHLNLPDDLVEPA